MHCGICANTTVEVRPCHISKGEDAPPIDGDVYLCERCANVWAAKCPDKDSTFITWVGLSCDECGTPSAFDGDVRGMPTGIVCEECSVFGLDYEEDRGKWLCVSCYETNHYGHRQKQLQPILDRLANL
jgi:protein-arginine kinase activator protein McsA